MPFLDLDDSQQFKNLTKIWIYVVVSVASTGLTFLASTIWDKFLISGGLQSAVISGEETLTNNDEQLLEPQSHSAPSPADLLEQVITMLSEGDNHAQTTNNALITNSDVDEIPGNDG